MAGKPNAKTMLIPLEEDDDDDVVIPQQEVILPVQEPKEPVEMIEPVPIVQKTAPVVKPNAKTMLIPLEEDDEVIPVQPIPQPKEPKVKNGQNGSVDISKKTIKPKKPVVVKQEPNEEKEQDEGTLVIPENKPDNVLVNGNPPMAPTHRERVQQITGLAQAGDKLAIFAEMQSQYIEELEQTNREARLRYDNEVQTHNGDVLRLKLSLAGKEEELTKLKEIQREELSVLDESAQISKSEIKRLEKALRDLKADNGPQVVAIQTLTTEKAGFQAEIERLNKLIERMRAGGAAEVAGLYTSNPLSLDSGAMYRQLGASLSKLSYKGKFKMEVRINNEATVSIPHVHLTTNPSTQEPCYAVSFGKKTLTRYEGLSMRKDTLSGHGNMQVILRDNLDTIIEDVQFDYSLNTRESEPVHHITAGRVNVFMNDIGEGTFKLKMILINTRV